MEKYSSNDNPEPTALAFTAVNHPPQRGKDNIPTRRGVGATPSEPSNKRRKKQKDNNLLSPPRTAKSALGRITRKSNAVNHKNESRNAAKETKYANKSKSTQARSVLSETTRSKLNALPTPASHNDIAEEEHTLPDILPRSSVVILDSEDHAISDDILSSDLWKNQEPLLNYPWLYGSYDSETPTEVVPAPNNRESIGSRYFTTFLQTEAQQNRGIEEDPLMSDEELERLFDEMVDSDVKTTIPESSKQRDIQEPAVIPLSKNESSNDENGEYDFPMDEETLETIYEATNTSNSPRKPVGTIDQEVISGLEGIDFSEDSLQDMLDLIESSPGSVTEDQFTTNRIPESPVNVKPRLPSTNTTEFSSGGEPRVEVMAIHNRRDRFVRAPHPIALEIPGPIPGLSPEKRILTCFRIGEAINATTMAQRQGFKVFVELYARVLHSVRAGPVQTFRIVDLWSSPEKLGIALDGRWVGWETDKLWEQDGRVFWEDGFRDTKYDQQGRERPYARKCRLVGSLERKATGGWSVDILNLWEAGWDDIAFAKQVFCKSDEDLKL